MRVDEAGHQQERTPGVGVARPAAGVAVVEPGDDPGGDQRVAPGPAVGERRAVRLGSDPAGEAVGIERVRVEVALHVLRQHLARGRNPRHRRLRPEGAPLRERGHDVAVGSFPFSAVGKAKILDDTRGFVKIVSEKRYGEVLGVHIVGPHATDLISEACVALRLEATTEEIFEGLIPENGFIDTEELTQIVLKAVNLGSR